jgi:hypothetical protein
MPRNFGIEILGALTTLPRLSGATGTQLLARTPTSLVPATPVTPTISVAPTPTATAVSPSRSTATSLVSSPTMAAKMSATAPSAVAAPAPKVDPAKQAASALVATNAGNRALAVSKKLASLKKAKSNTLRAGRKLETLGKKAHDHAAKAKQTATQIHGLINATLSAAPTGGGSASPAPMTRGAGTSLVLSDTGSGVNPFMAYSGAIMEQQLQLITQFALATQALADVGDIIAQIDPVIQQVQATNPTLAQQGQAIEDQCNAIINNADTDIPQANPDEVAGLKQQALDWISQAQAAGATVQASADAGAYSSAAGGYGGGSPGGGGDGGADDGSSAAEEVQRFRESGGSYDPFSDGGDDQGGDMDSSSDDSMSDDSQQEDPFADSGSQDSLDGRFDTSMVPTARRTYATTATSADAQSRLDASKQQLADVLSQQAAFRPYSAPQFQANVAVAPGASFADLLSQSRDTFFDTQSDDGGDTVEGDGTGIHFSETPDLGILWEEQITDEPADPSRNNASMHHGSAYYQNFAYPRGGATDGQEGGMLGEYDPTFIFGGLEVLGAAMAPRRPVPARAGFVLKQTAQGRPFTSLVVGQPKLGDHKKSIANARDVAKRAQSFAAKAQKQIDKLKKIGIHGVAPIRRVQRAISVAQAQNIVKKLDQRGKKLAQSADKHSTTVQTATAKQAQGLGKIAQKMKMAAHSGTRIDGDIFGYDEIMGDTAWQILSDDSIMFGYDLSRDLLFGDDPSAVPPPDDGSAVAVDPNTGDVADSDIASQLGSPPTLDSVKADALTKAQKDPRPGTFDDPTVYTTLPQGAVIFDNSHPWRGVLPVASYQRYFGGPGEGGGKSGYNWDDTGDSPGWWHHISSDPSADQDHKPHSDEMADIQAASVKRGHGPLMGGPGTDWKGLRYTSAPGADGKGQWFWYRDQAPDWATQDEYNTLLSQALLDYNAQAEALKTDAATKAAQDALDAAQADALAKQQASEDAQTQRQYDQENAQGAHDAEQQARADEAAARQAQQAADVSASYDTRMLAAQAEADRAAAAQQAELDYQAAVRAAEAEAGAGGGDDSDAAAADAMAQETYLEGLTGSARIKAMRGW